MSEIDSIDDQLRRAFEGDAWHGPAVRALLTEVTAARAAARPLRGVHSIWEIVRHISTWKKVVRRRLQGVVIGELLAAEDWPVVQDMDEEAWSKTLQELEQEHRALRDTIARLDDGCLAEIVPGKNYSVYVMLHGVIQHDLYHAGQIALLKKTQG